MPLNPLNHHYAIENPASVYDEEAMTALELAGRTTAKVNEAVDAFNRLESDTEQHLNDQDHDMDLKFTEQNRRLTKMETEQIPNTVTAEVREHIEGGAFDTAIDAYAGNLSDRVDNLVGAVAPGSTSGDAELIDGRTNELGQTHANIGNAIRRNAENITKVSGLLTHGVNLVDPSTIKIGGFINQTNGNLEVNAGHTHSGFIDVKPGATYVITIFNQTDTSIVYRGNNAEGYGDFRVAFYDSDKKYISGEHAPRNIVAPENAYYIRFSSGNATPTNLYQMTEGGGVDRVYHRYTTKIREDFMQRDDVLKIITKPTVNLLCPANMVDNTYVNQETGAYHSGTTNSVNFVCFKNLQATGGVTYQMGEYLNGVYKGVNETRIAFYDEEKNFLCGFINNTSVVSPVDAKWVSISFTKTSNDIFLGIGDTQMDYSDFTGYIHPGYLGISLDNTDDEMELNLPSKVYALVGQELNIYFDNLVYGKDTDYVFDVICSVGQHMENCYRITPTASQVGNHSLTITATKNGIMVSKTATLVVAPTNAGSGSTRSVLIMGDSTTASGIITSKLLENFNGDPMNITTLGTMGSGVNKHEGRSGWTINAYINNTESPFYNPITATFDADYYFSHTSVAKPDYFVMALGINDVFLNGSKENIEHTVSLYGQAVNSIKSASPDSKVCIALTIPPNYSQDAFGRDYGCDQNRNTYKTNNINLVRLLIDTFQGREGEGIYLIPIHTNLDTRNNMGTESMQVNKRNPATHQVPVASGGVHPNTYGYWQIADAYWFFLKGMEV